MTKNNAVPLGSLASATGVKVQNTRFSLRAGTFPVAIALFGQANTNQEAVATNTPLTITSTAEAAMLFGYGSPLHKAVKVLYNPNNSIGSIPLTVFVQEHAINASESKATLTLSGIQTKTADYLLSIGAVDLVFTITEGLEDSEVASLIISLVNKTPDMSVIASLDDTKTDPTVVFTSKWRGASANALTLTVVGDNLGVDIVHESSFTGGTNDPSIVKTLENFGSSPWYTHVISQYDTKPILDAITDKSQELWQPMTAKPFLAFYGARSTDRNNAVNDTDIAARKLQYALCKVDAPDSPNLPIEIAASAVAVVANTAMENPPLGYNKQPLWGIKAGNPTKQYDYNTRDFIVKRGCSTTTLENGMITIGDMVSTYHKDGGEAGEDYAFVNNLMKLFCMTYNMYILFEGERWRPAILVNDSDMTTNVKARKPSTAKADIFDLVDTWGAEALITNVPETKKNTIVARDKGNPNRLNVQVPVILSGSTNLMSVMLLFSTEVLVK